MTNRALAILPAFLLATAVTATSAQAEGQPGQPMVVASAPSATPVTANGAPQNADWNDLSHMNGQLVKVGETNDYKKKFKRTNISTNPIGWMYGSFGLSVGYGMNDHIAIRGDVNYLSNYLDQDTTGMEIGVGVPIYFRRTYQGVFLEPGFISRRTEERGWCDFDCSTAATETVTTFGPQMLVGWHWTWDSGLNVAVAGGIGRNWASGGENSEGRDQSEPFANGYLRFGYAF